VREVQEPFAAGQKGSSAMPHKRNPVVSERVSGLARVIRGYAQAALEDMPLWHERDISHSSAERVILPDATGLLYFMLSDMAWVMDGLHVDAARMRINMESTGGIFFSQKVLTALVDHGMARDAAYAAVQRAAKDTWEGGLRFKERVWDEIAGADVLSEAEFEELFQVEPYLANLDGVFERLEKLPVEEA
jgi:adenylosuccinate lyase